VEIKLVGSYHQIAMFFQSVGDLSRIVNIGNLVMGGAKVADGRTTISIDCLATTFRFVESAAKDDAKKEKQ
jgi:type IV pilus assembly protein PilO